MLRFVWPALFAPQQTTSPESRTAQVWLAPALTDRNLPTGASVWPSPFNPQQTTSPDACSAQV